MRQLLFVLVFWCPTVIADVIFKSTAEISVYAEIDNSTLPAEQQSKWPNNSLFTGVAYNESWLEVNGVFQNGVWLELTSPVFVPQSESIVLVSDIKNEKELINKQIADLSKWHDVTSLPQQSVSQWQQKQFFKRWVDGVVAQDYWPPTLRESEQHRHIEKSVKPISEVATNNSLKLNGNKSSIAFSFGTRLDRAVESAELDLEYMYSPSLLDVQSQVKVYFLRRMMRKLVGRIYLIEV